MLRDRFAFGLQTLLPQSVRHLVLYYEGGDPENHDCSPSCLHDSSSPDPLSVALRTLSQRLITMSIDDRIVLDAEVFWPVATTPAAPIPQFPNMEILSICTAAVTASGTWLFEPDPSLGGRPDSPDSELRHPLVFDEEEEFECREYMLNDYRCLVVPDLANQFLLAAAGAAAHMPRLSSLEITMASTCPVWIYLDAGSNIAQPTLKIQGTNLFSLSDEVKEAWQVVAQGRIGGSCRGLNIEFVREFANAVRHPGLSQPDGSDRRGVEVVESYVI